MLSPINQKLIQNQKSDKPIVNPSKITSDAQIKKDTLELSEKEKNKQALFNSIISALTFVGAFLVVDTIAFLIKLNYSGFNINKIIKNAAKEFNEVSEIIKKAKSNDYSNDTNGAVTRIFGQIKGYGAKFLEEHQNGKIIRRTEFNPEDGTIYNITKNFKRTSEDIYGAEERYMFKDGILSHFARNCARNKDGSEYIEDLYEFANGKIKKHLKNMKLTPFQFKNTN